MRESASHSSRVRHDPRFTGPSEKSLCEYRVAPGMAMTVGMTMVLPSSHSFTQWGRLCQNGSWGETPVRRCSTSPLDDFPLQAGASGTSRLARARFGKSNDRISDPFRQALGITGGYWAQKPALHLTAGTSPYRLRMGCVLRYNKQGLCVPQKSPLTAEVG